MKAVGIMDVSSDSAFEVILSLDRHQRYEYANVKIIYFLNVTCIQDLFRFVFVAWNSDFMYICRWDALTSDLELVDSISGNSDVVYGSYDPRHINRYTI